MGFSFSQSVSKSVSESVIGHRRANISHVKTVISIIIYNTDVIH